MQGDVMLFIDNLLGRTADPPEPPPPDAGSAMVNGVVLPRLVLEQLQKLGISLAWYSEYELGAAVRACAVDCTLIDDPDGNNFLDNLELDAHEIAAEHDDFDPRRLHRLKTTIYDEPDEKTKNLFGERIKSERRKQSAETAGHAASYQSCA